jgi:hypothetical protein
MEYSQKKLADLCGVEEQTVRNWEKYARVPKLPDRYVRILYREKVLRDSQPAARVIRAALKPDGDTRAAVNWNKKPSKPWRGEEAA